MKLFKRTPKISVTVSHDGLSVEGADIETAEAFVVFWATNFGKSEDEPAKKPLGFNNDHVSEVESDTMVAHRAAVEDFDDEDDD